MNILCGLWENVRICSKVVKILWNLFWVKISIIDKQNVCIITRVKFDDNSNTSEPVTLLLLKGNFEKTAKYNNFETNWHDIFVNNKSKTLLLQHRVSPINCNTSIQKKNCKVFFFCFFFLKYLFYVPEKEKNILSMF